MNNISLYTFEYPPQRGGVANYYFGIKSALEKISAFVVDIKYFKIPLRWWQLVFPILFDRNIFIGVGNILPIGTAALIASYFSNKKYILFLHGMDINLALHNKPYLTKKIINRAHLIVCNSEYTKSLVIGARPENTRIIILYPCPNINTNIDASLETDICNQYDLSGQNYLLYVGRLTERKGAHRLIKIMPKLLKKNSKLRLFILGDGNEKNDLNKLIIDNNLQASVKIITDISDAALKVFYKYASLFAMPVIDKNVDIEGFGIVYLEAALFSLPVIASDVGGVSEAVVANKTGFLIKDDNDLYDKIEQLLSDNNTREIFGQAAKLRVDKYFKYTQQVQKLIPYLYE